MLPRSSAAVLHLRSYKGFVLKRFKLGCSAWGVSEKPKSLIIEFELIWKLQSRLLVISTSMYFWAVGDFRAHPLWCMSLTMVSSSVKCTEWSVSICPTDICHALFQPQCDDMFFCSFALSSAFLITACNRQSFGKRRLCESILLVMPYM